MRICISNMQTAALVNLLNDQAATSCSIDLLLRINDLHVTVWRNGEPRTWYITLDGTTKEL